VLTKLSQQIVSSRITETPTHSCGGSIPWMSYQTLSCYWALPGELLVVAVPRLYQHRCHRRCFSSGAIVDIRLPFPVCYRSGCRCCYRSGCRRLVSPLFCTAVAISSAALAAYRVLSIVDCHAKSCLNRDDFGLLAMLSPAVTMHCTGL
jgi:hypothetical protein